MSAHLLQRGVAAPGTLGKEVRALLSLAVPTVLGLISTVAMAVIDTAMLAPLGPDVVAATGLATSAFLLVNSALIGFASVIGVHVAQAVGARDPRRIASSIANGLALAAVLSVLSALCMLLLTSLIAQVPPEPALYELASGYWLALTGAVLPHTLLAALRAIYTAVDRAWVALAFTLFGIGLNVPLNLILIHGALGLNGLGIVGAGAASFAAKLVTLGVFALHLHRVVLRDRKMLRPAVRFAQIRRQLRRGLPVALGSVAEGGAYATTGFLSGQLGIVALAAHQVVHSIGVLFYMVPIGMMIAASIRTGRVVGARRSGNAAVTLFAANSISLTWSLLVVVMVLAFREFVAGALSPNEQIADLSAALFVTMAYIQFADGIQSNAMGVLRGLGDHVVPNTITGIGYWCIGLPLAAGLGLTTTLGVVGIGIGYGTAVLAVAAALQMRAARLVRPIRTRP